MILGTMSYITVEPPRKGHFGDSGCFVPCWDAVLFSKVEKCINSIQKYTVGDMESVLCREVVPFS